MHAIVSNKISILALRQHRMMLSADTSRNIELSEWIVAKLINFSSR